MGDHPRSRGVYDGTMIAQYIDAGSSPLARGLHFRLRRSHAINRIIPARAGFTRLFPSLLSATKDHPRSRGVYPGESSTPFVFRGSSPLARGLLNVNSEKRERMGIIPARAGFT